MSGRIPTPPIYVPSDPDPPPDLSGYVTTQQLTDALAGLSSSGGGGATDATIQAWIRGTGLFRRVLALYDSTMTDEHWQSFLCLPGYGGLPGAPATNTLTVTQPTGALASLMNSLSPVPADAGGWNMSELPPQGAWTLLFLPDNDITVNLSFPEVAKNVRGYDGGTGTTFIQATPYSRSLPSRRLVFLMFLGMNHYYLHIF